MKTEPDLSIVVTVLNDAAGVVPLVEEIERSLRQFGPSYEVILVDDCSGDQTYAAVEDACRTRPNFRGLSLSRRFGQQIAVSAGVRFAKGRHVLVMDGDLQNPPSAIPRLYEEIGKGFDIVYATSKTRNNFFDEINSRILWFILNRLLKIQIVPHQLMMRIMSARMAREFNSYSELNRTVAAITHDIGHRCGSVEVQNQRRARGRTNYRYLMRLDILIDAILSFSTRPLKAIILFSLLVLAGTTVLSAAYLYLYWTSRITVPGHTSLILLVMFFGSLQLFALGLIGRYLADINLASKRRPLFFVDRTTNLDAESV